MFKYLFNGIRIARPFLGIGIILAIVSDNAVGQLIRSGLTWIVVTSYGLS